MDPQQELFTALLIAAREQGYDVYDGALPPEDTPYPVSYTHLDVYKRQASGVALAYKLQAMSNLALTFDRKIEKSLRKRYKLFCSLSTNVANPDAWRDMEFKMARNLPRNIQEETAVAAQAEGLVSKRTQLELLSYVPDPAVELERMEKEEAAGAESAVDRRMFSTEGAE